MSAAEAPLIRRLGDALASARRNHGRNRTARTRLVGNVITCTIPRQGETEHSASGAYRREAIAAVVRVTRQRVSAFSEASGPEDETIEIFTLEASAGRGRPREVGLGR